MHQRRGQGSRGGKNPPRRFNWPSNDDRVGAYLESIAPGAVFAGTDGSTVEEMLKGADDMDFSRVHHMPRGDATLNPELISRLWHNTFDGRKSLAMQRLSLTVADVIAPHNLHVMEGSEGVYYEHSTIVGTVVPVKSFKDPGSKLPSYRLLSWKMPDGKFKYVSNDWCCVHVA